MTSSERGSPRVTWLELTGPPAAAPEHRRPESIGRERLALEEYLALYREVGAPWRWDQRLRMPQEELESLLGSRRSVIYVLRDGEGCALGLCEFERGDAEAELRNFGLVPRAQGRGLGPWLLHTALAAEWSGAVRRIWLHTDEWDHPAAVPVYLRAGFRVTAVREQEPGDL